MTPQFFDQPIVELAAALRRGETSLPEIMGVCLDRLQRSSALNAFTEVFADDARALAQSYQQLLDRGYDLGPLHGMPIALKANIAVTGRPMTAGSKLLRDHRAEEDAVVTKHLKKAGAVITGFTNMHEFAWGGTTTNPHYGQCHNPWDTRRIPAGSSGGSGAAVAVGSAVATLGTDTGGSVRLPASMNGVTGLRPGVGRVSNDGVFPLALTMDTVGPLARSSADCALMFAAIAGEDVDPPAASRMMAELERPLRSVTVALIDGYSEAGLVPDIAAAFTEILTVLEACEATVTRVSVEGLAVAVDAQIIVDAAEPSAVHDAWLGAYGEAYGADVRALLQAGLGFTAAEYLHAQRYRTYLRQQFDRLFNDVDFILTPTLPFTAPLIGQERIMIGNTEESTLTGNMRFTCIPSLTGLPAISFPIGFDSQNLPIGAQLMAPSGQEMRLLQTVHAIQKRTEFHNRRPGYLNA